MVTIDPRVTAALAGPGSGAVSAIVVCAGECEPVLEALNQAGISVRSSESMMVGSIAVDLTGDQLNAIRSIPGIDAIELDEEVQAF